MTRYICKCGAIKRKSTDADNTGNRDTEHCRGCPYLLPYGEQEYVKGEGFRLKVKGYECRMSQELTRCSAFIGRVKDKCTCSVVSLDYDFLEEISSWIRKTYPNGELSGGFSRANIRPTDFSNNGRYRYSISCSQNRAGMAAKAALMERFFNPDRTRKDMTPQEEEAKILKGIEDGKRAAQQLPGPSGAALAAAPGASLAEPAQSTSAPAFDTTGLDRQTVIDLELAEREYRAGRRMAEAGLRRMADGVAIAHDALCGPYAANQSISDGTAGVVASCDKSKYGNRGEDTFRTWCESMGISKDTAYRLLQVSALFEQSSPRQQKVLEELSPSLLYAAARPSAPAELVEQVKSGDITTHKQYQELLAELKAKDDTIKEKEAALLKAQQAADLAQTTANIYEAQKKSAEEQCLALIDENEAQTARIAEMESRPIEATAATEEEIARWRAEGAKIEAEANAAAYKTVCDQRDEAAAAAQKANEKAEKAQREVRRLRETLQGRTDHLNAVEADLKAIKQKLTGAQNALPRLPGPHTAAVPPAQTPPALVLCRQCVYEPICCGIRFLGEEDMSEEMYAGFADLDEDAFDARLVGCTAGQTKESR